MIRRVSAFHSLVDKTSRETMISRSLLLLFLSSCLCAATFVVNVSQSSYQAEENHSITLEWSFTTTPDTCLSFQFMIFTLVTEQKISVLFHEHEGVEVPMSQDQQFAGRVQCDKELLRDGRIKLQVSKLRIGDSGLYVCEIKTDCGFSSGACQVLVKAADNSPSDPPPENKGLIALYVLLALAAVGGAAAGLYFWKKNNNSL